MDSLVFKETYLFLGRKEGRKGRRGRKEKEYVSWPCTEHIGDSSSDNLLWLTNELRQQHQTRKIVFFVASESGAVKRVGVGVSVI